MNQKRLTFGRSAFQTITFLYSEVRVDGLVSRVKTIAYPLEISMFRGGQLRFSLGRCGRFRAMVRQARGNAGQALEEARKLGRAAKSAREAAQQELLLGAMAKAVAAKGYEACRVDDVLAASGLSRSTYYRHFDSKEECFAAAFEWAAEGVLAAVREVLTGGAGEPGDQVEAALEGMLAELASRPGTARLVLVEARAASAVCRKAYARWLERFGDLLDEATGRVDPGLARLTVGAILALLSSELLENGAESLPSTLPQLVYVALLAPYVGAHAASGRAGAAGHANADT
jgi:AcrR family transcriptional regulator